MHYIKTAFIVAAVALLSACAGGPKYAEVASAIPAQKSGEGRIYFYRESSMVGAAIQPDIQLNGAKVGESVPGGFFFVDQKPGSMKVATSTEVEKQLTFTLDPGQVRYVKTVIGFGLVAGRVYPELVDPATGRKDIESLSYTGTPLAGKK